MGQNKMSDVNVDLEGERRSTASEDLCRCIYGDRMLPPLKRLFATLSQNPIFDAKDLWNVSKKHRFLKGCEKAAEFVRLIRLNDWVDNQDVLCAMELMMPDDFFIFLHLTMFIPAIQNLADDEQIGWWLAKAKNFEILGTYAQSEVGHGSNVSGLCTTATFDEKTDEWILATDNLISYKFWPGGLAKSCTHCILMGRVIIAETDHGVHAFLLQIRSLEDHTTLPGISLFDVGAKLGYNAMDNGCMVLDAVRIPRRNLLMRYVVVDRGGSCWRVGDKRMLYATMSYTRKQMICAAGIYLAKAVVIAVRYSAVRRQFGTRENIESKILDYSTQQFTLLSMLATALGFYFVGRYVDEIYNKSLAAARAGDFQYLHDMHTMTSSLKAMMTTETADGIEKCRRCCGGHGFLLSAGIPIIYGNYVAQATYEGDFVVLSIQAGRSLLKTLEKGHTKPNSRLEYILKASDPKLDFDLLNVDFLLWAYMRRSRYLLTQTAAVYVEELDDRLTVDDVLDNIKIELTMVTSAHAHVEVLRSFWDMDKKLADDPTISQMSKDIIHRLCLLYGLYWMHKGLADFISAGCIPIDKSSQILKQIKIILKEIRPDAVPITDAWWFPDYLLNSTIGSWDGRAYERMFAALGSEPLNRSDVSEAYGMHIKKILRPCPNSRL